MYDLASNIETRLVKPRHPLEEIAARVLRESRDSGVYLTSSKNDVSQVDPVAATIQALSEPLEFPPLSAGIVPGDRVVIAVDDAVPCVACVACGAVVALRQAGVEPQDISIVTTEAGTSELCREELARIAPGPKIVVHDPSDENNLCWVGATRRGRPLNINRTIFDADIVLPIGCARVHGQGVYDCLYPRFSNTETVEKHRTPARPEGIRRHNGGRTEADEAGWLIGVPMTVQVVPGRGETVAHVLAGEPHAVARRSRELCRQQWLLHGPQRVSLLIATITGGVLSQTWANVGRALATAEHVLEEGGAVAICTNLDELPGQSLGRLIGSPDLDRAARNIFHDHDADTWPAWQLARALQRGPVYFLSQLDPQSVEDLGLAPVESIDDLVRLAGRHDSFTVMEDAQHAAVKIAGEGDDAGTKYDE
jgi:nickel-dependent lactate racemase